MFNRLLHFDWSVRADKRWYGTALRTGDGWTIEPARPAPDDVLSLLFAQSDTFATLAGFDMPIGLPTAIRASFPQGRFPEVLLELGQGAWQTFFDVADHITSVHPWRPFYPQRALRGQKQQDLARALGVEHIDQLRRRCERAGHGSPAACPLFWTLGANQVGKAAIFGWRNILQPAVRRGAHLWPFDGDLDTLAKQSGVVVCETWPAWAARALGLERNGYQSKRKQLDRRDWCRQLLRQQKAVWYWESAALDQMATGFGSRAWGEDAFDAMLGVLHMTSVVDGHHPEEYPEDPTLLNWEGWILGRAGAVTWRRCSGGR
ncbi:DUF429 domain-containing protein [Kushneria phosphatilytica]|uniref:DUF429 domain-containing protein n=1 Tax=Kushneria phosphatilytica TaxID=657387 RepID=A0A1S1P0V4_9GAMM|nr:DUF429 domain-containing protein [Kushneria phosphatilytica]OHV13058.1 hypothetical protein BH688_03415 [Kushneria phosphatilytica]QEL10930.1 DUF429 domain-containing protein [Kushneria phosphatilytica]